MGLKRYFDLSMAEKIIIVITQFIEGNEKIWINKVRCSVGVSSNRIFDDCIYLLMNYGLIKKENCSTKSKKGQKTYITVTGLCNQIVKYGYIKPFLEDEVLPNVPSKGKRRGKKIQLDKDDPHQELQLIEEQEIQQNRRKAIHFLLTRGAYGVGYNIPLDPGGIYYRSEHHEGVSIMDLVEQRDDNFMYINAHIRVSKSEAERIMRILLAEGIMKEINQMDNISIHGNGQGEDARYSIKDKSLAEYVLQWGSFQNDVLGRMLYLYDSIRGTMRGIHPIQNEVNWLRDLIGPGRAQKWLTSASDRRDKELVPYVNPSLQDINKLDTRVQKSIHKRRKIALQEADLRILKTFREISNNPELLKVEENHPIITRIIKRSAYPEFLQELYRRRRRRKT